MPPAGWYLALGIKVSRDPEKDKPDTERLYLRMLDGEAAGFETFDFIHNTLDAQGNPLPGLTADQISGRKGAVVAKLLSAGYTQAQIDEGGINDAWLTNEKRVFHIGWVPPQEGVKGSYGEVSFWTKEEWEAKKASGAVPTRRPQRGQPPAGASGADNPPPPTPAAPNGGTVPPPVAPAASSTGSGALPPPPPPP